MTCLHCGGRYYPDEGVFTCINCGRPRDPVVPLPWIHERGRSPRPLSISEYDGKSQAKAGSNPQQGRRGHR
jgi:hypothetical protein